MCIRDRYKPLSNLTVWLVGETMSKGLHILSFRNKLTQHRKFLKLLQSPKISTRKLIIQKASDKELRLIQKLLTLFLRGEIGVTQHFFNRLRRTKKLAFIEENFEKIRPDPNLRANLLKLAPLLHLFVKVVLKKNGPK